MDELYGGYDQNTREWTDGILSSLMRSVSADEKPDEVYYFHYYFCFVLINSHRNGLYLMDQLILCGLSP